MANQFKDVLTIEDLTMDSTVTLSTTKDTEVATYQVGAQQKVAIGSGAIVNGVDDRGLIKIDFKDASGNLIAGKVTLRVSDANRRNNPVIDRFRTEQVDSTNSSGRRIQYSLPSAREDSFLVIEMRADASATISKTNSSVELPVTVTNL